MTDLISNEMMIYAATALGGSVIHLGNNLEARSKVWRLFAVILAGGLFGMALTDPAHKALQAMLPFFDFNESSKLAIALILGLISPRVVTLIDKGMKKLEDDPGILHKWFTEMIKRNFGKHEYSGVV